jgi:hypothetical protein
MGTVYKGENGVSLTRIASDSTRLEYSPMDGNPGYILILDPKNASDPFSPLFTDPFPLDCGDDALRRHFAATYTLPAESTLRPCGPKSMAAVAGPPSPE